MTIITTPPALPDLFGSSPADLVDRWAEAPEQSTAEEARERADQIRDGLPSYVRIQQLIADSHTRRDFAALGYGSWAEYAMAEFGPLLLRIARAERPEAARDLRDKGMSTRQIAKATGVTHTQVQRDLKAKVEPNVPPESVDAPRADPAPEAKPVPEPARVTGSDGKSYPASRPKPPEPTDPAVVEAREQARREARDRDAGRTWAARIVPDLQTAVATIAIAVQLGEPDLITAEMVRQCREAVDLLDAIFKGEK